MDDSEYLRLAQSVLAGAPHDPHDDTAAACKTLTFMFMDGGSDTWITADQFRVRSVARGTMHRYDLEMAPDVVWDLMGRMKVEHVVEPTVGGLHPERGRLKLFAHRDLHTDMIGWIVPRSSEIAIHLRPPQGSGRPPTGPIPKDGPWVRPQPWHPGPRVVTFASEVQCIHCGQSSQTWRVTNDAFFICPVCSRSSRRDSTEREPSR
jgi:hypothetical protein